MLEGIFPVVAMPFTETGEIDYQGFKNLVNHLESIFLQGMILFGIASEFYKINDFEKDKLVELYIKNKASKTKKIISVTDHSTELAIKRSISYEKKGADALMLLPPFFLNPSREDLLEHVSKVLESVSIPVILQYAPKETNCLFTMNDMFELGQKYTHLIYKIESPNPMIEIKKLLEIYPNANILNGYAGIHMLSVLDVGGVGIIPGCSFVEIYLNIYNLYISGKIKEAEHLHTELKQYIDIWMGSIEHIIQVEKSVLKYRNIIKSDYCRKPSYNKTVNLQHIETFYDKFSLSFGDNYGTV